MTQYKITFKEKQIVDVLEFDSNITIISGTDAAIKVFITADLLTAKKVFKDAGFNISAIEYFLTNN